MVISFRLYITNSLLKWEQKHGRKLILILFHLVYHILIYFILFLKLLAYVHR
jgi:hypothetical protein